MKRLFVSLVIALVVWFTGCGEENPVGPTGSANGISIEVERLEAYYIPLRWGENIAVYIYLKVENLEKDSQMIADSSFSLQDIKQDINNSIVYNVNEVRLFDPKTHIPPQNREEYVYEDIPELLVIRLKPKSQISIGLHAAYAPSEQKGDWYLVFNGKNNTVEIPIQKMIKENMVTLPSTPEVKPEPKPEKDQSHFNWFNWKEYFPLKVGTKWFYQIEIEGEISSFYFNVVKQTIYIDEKKYFQLDSGRTVGKESLFAYYSYSNNNEILCRDFLNGEDYIYLSSMMIIGEEMVKVPAGEIQCIKIQRGKRVEWYGKNAGLVKIHEFTPNNPPENVVHTLVNYEP